MILTFFVENFINNIFHYNNCLKKIHISKGTCENVVAGGISQLIRLIALGLLVIQTFIRLPVLLMQQVMQRLILVFCHLHRKNNHRWQIKIVRN